MLFINHCDDLYWTKTCIQYFRGNTWTLSQELTKMQNIAGRHWSISVSSIPDISLNIWFLGLVSYGRIFHYMFRILKKQCTNILQRKGLLHFTLNHQSTCTKSVRALSAGAEGATRSAALQRTPRTTFVNGARPTCKPDYNYKGTRELSLIQVRTPDRRCHGGCQYIPLGSFDYSAMTHLEGNNKRMKTCALIQ